MYDKPCQRDCDHDLRYGGQTAASQESAPQIRARKKKVLRRGYIIRCSRTAGKEKHGHRKPNETTTAILLSWAGQPLEGCYKKPLRTQQNKNFVAFKARICYNQNIKTEMCLGTLADQSGHSRIPTDCLQCWVSGIWKFSYKAYLDLLLFAAALQL